MCDIAAFLLMYFVEEEAFWTLVKITSDPRFDMAGRWVDGFPKLRRAMFVHNKLLEQHMPKVAKLLVKHSIGPSFYTMKWYLRMYVDVLDYDTTLRIWDVLLNEGTDILFAVSLVLMAHAEADLLSKSDEMEIMALLQSLDTIPKGTTPQSFMEEVKEFKLDRKQITKWEKQYDANPPNKSEL